MADKWAHLLGQSAPIFYSSLVEMNPSIAALGVAAYNGPPEIQKRGRLTSEELRLADIAARKREESFFSYLELLLELSSSTEHEVEGILDAVAYHQSHPVERTWLSRDLLLDGALMDMAEQLPPNKHIAVFAHTQSVSLERRCIPLLDLRIEKGDQSLAIVSSLAKRLLPSGFAVLASDRSYHLVGFEQHPVTNEVAFLAKALLFSPIVDHAYIAHQLIEGEACLRVSARTEGIAEPRVVAVGDRESLTTESNATSG